MNSRKAGHLQPFTYVDVQLSKGRGASWLVTQVSTIEAYPDILASLDKTVRTSCVLGRNVFHWTMLKMFRSFN